jgi:hypothetical protein
VKLLTEQEPLPVWICEIRKQEERSKMATITLNVLEMKYYESDSKQYPGSKVKRKVLKIKEDSRTVSIFRRASNAAEFDKIFNGSVITLDDSILEPNSFTNKEGIVVNSIQFKKEGVFLVSGGTPPVAAPVLSLQLGQVASTPAPTQGIVLGQSAPAVQPQEQLSAKDIRIQQQADKRDAIMERQIKAIIELTIAIEMLVKATAPAVCRPLTAYPDGITQEEMEKQDTGPSDEQLQAMYDEEGY